MPERVMYFTDSEGYGGAERALLILLEGLDRERWSPSLVCHDSPGLARVVDAARSLDVRVLLVPPMPLGLRGAARLPSLWRVLGRERPSVFHAHLTWPLGCKQALLGAIAARIPAVFATLQLFVDAPYTRWTGVQQRWIARGLTRYIVVSAEVARRVHAAFGIDPGRLAVVHNAVPILERSDNATAAARTPFPENGNRPVVFTAARLDPQKGLDYLIGAAALVPEAMFLVAGDGPERGRLDALVQDRGLSGRVKLLGHRDDVPDLLARCDVFVLPSLYEGLPLSVLEAMAAARPVVATAVGGTDEAVADGETGLLVPARDSEALASGIRRILGAPALARRLAAAGRERVEREFSATAMVAQVTGLYESALAPGGRCA
ncbi:MAG: glycosyltransferase [Chloroflexota bacterium]